MQQNEYKVKTFCKSIICTNVMVVVVVLFFSCALLNIIWGVPFALNVDKLTAEIRMTPFKQILLHIEERVKTQVAVMSLGAVPLIENRLNITDYDAVMQHCWSHFMMANKTLTTKDSIFVSCFLGRSNGNIIGYYLDFATNSMMNYVNWDYINQNNIRYASVVDETGDLDLANGSEFEYTNPFGIWYQVANKSFTPAYTPTYTDPNYPGTVWITLVVPVRGKDGSFRGYIGTDDDVSSLGKFLASPIRSLGHAEAFIIERSTGFLVASSNSASKAFEEVIDKDTGTKTLIRNRAIDTPAGFASGATAKLTEMFDQSLMLPSDKTIQMSVRIDNAQVLVSAQRFVNSANIDWIVVLAIPEIIVLSEVTTAAILVAVCCVLLLIASVTIVIVAATVIYRPFQVLVRDMKAVENLKMENVKLMKFSYFSEINKLQSAFNRMVTMLIEYRPFIPDHILAQFEEDEPLEIQRPSVKNQVLPLSSQTSIRLERKATPESKYYVDDRKSTVSDSMKTESQHESDAHDIRSSQSLNRFKLGLEVKEVTLAMVKIAQDVDTLMDSVHPEDFVQQFEDFVTLVQSTAQAYKGTIADFGHDYFIIAWNCVHRIQDTQKAASDSVHKACSAIIKIHEGMNSLRYKWNASAHTRSLKSIAAGSAAPQLCTESLDIVSAVYHGSSWVGNLGNQRLKHLAYLGSTWKSLHRLMSKGESWGTKKIISDSVYKHIQGHFTTRFSGVCNGNYCYELGVSSSIQSDEWLYEIEAEKKVKEWETYRAAIEQLFGLNFKAAVSLMEDHLLKSHDDRLAKTWLEFCKRCLQSSEKWNPELLADAIASFPNT